MSKSKVVLILGEPGVGKTSITRGVIKSLGQEIKRFKFKLLNGVVVESPIGKVYFAGPYFTGEMFEGPDKLSMAVQPCALEFLRVHRPPVLYCDGDRLGNASFVEKCRELGCDVEIVRVDAEDPEAFRRSRGSKQTEKWISSRRNKVDNICDRFDFTAVLNVDLDESVKEVKDVVLGHSRPS